MLVLFLLSCSMKFPVLSNPWLEQPKVEICDGIVEKEDDILKAIDLWENLNSEYDIDSIERSDCSEDRKSGVIRFQEANQDDLDELTNDIDDCSRCQVAAFTTADRDRVNNINVTLAATVFITEDNNSTIIAHELGHAYGWLHTIGSETGHLMSPKHSLVNSRYGLDHYRDMTWYIE